MKYIIKHLKTLKEYLEELTDIHDKLGVLIKTDTASQDEIDKLLTRADEVVILCEFIKAQVAKGEQDAKNNKE